MASRARTSDTPAHHHPEGGFRNPGGLPQRGARDLLRWQRERWKQGLAPNPTAAALPTAAPQLSQPRAPTDELRVTWVGHATFLVQIGGYNVLTDPHWSPRASPVQWLGPRRFVPPGIAFDALPPIDAVVVSHDHFDHLDVRTVRRLIRRFGDHIRWFTPLGYGGWMRARGARRHVELDWWESAELGETSHLRITALPAQHWSSRSPWRRGERLWASWAMAASSGATAYFAGDSGYFPGFTAIGERLGPFEAVMLPIGAYEPRWFMRAVHLNPEEAVQAYRDLGASGTFCAMHWGTWRLTDENPLEPPARVEAAWRDAALPSQNLWVPRHGETRVMVSTREGGSPSMEG